MEPVVELIRGYIETDYDYPSTMGALRDDIDAAAREILEGLDGEALEEMRAANDVNLRMAPLTPDHHFYIDQGANAHLRLVLVAIGKKLAAMGALDDAEDVMFLRYNELRALIGDQSAFDARALVESLRSANSSARRRTSSGREHGSARRRRASSTSRTSSTGASRRSSIARKGRSRTSSRASAARRASSRASPGSCSARTSSTRSAPATSSSAT